MPQVRMLGVNKEVVAAVADAVTAEMAVITDCPAGDVVVSWLPIITYRNGKEAEHLPFVEVWWFDRGQASQDRVARSITRILGEHGVGAVDIAFNLYERSRYYENGEHF